VLSQIPCSIHWSLIDFTAAAASDALKYNLAACLTCCLNSWLGVERWRLAMSMFLLRVRELIRSSSVGDPGGSVRSEEGIETDEDDEGVGETKRSSGFAFFVVFLFCWAP
jgi:hypothetical protein